MNYLLGIVAFAFALVFSVVLHEAGHFLTAKRFGMKATQFFAGFGPTLWSRRAGETEYGIKALPLGGFVKIVGYTPLEEIDPADEPRAFYRQPAYQRAIVIVAGVVTNVVLAFVLLLVLAMVVGIPDTDRVTTLVRTVSPCVASQDTCAPDSPESPSKKAGLHPGDKVVSFAGRPVGDWDQLSAAIKATPPGTDAPVVVERHGRSVTLHAVVAASGGEGYFGMEPAYATHRLGPAAAVSFSGRFMGQMVRSIGQVVADLPHAIPKLFSPDRGSSPGGQAGSVVGGAEASGQVFSSVDSWQNKIGTFLLLIVSLNMFLALLNVVPLLPLDGGHLAIVVYGKVKTWLFRRRGRPDPGPVDITKLMPLTYLAFVLLVGLGILLILADVVNPLKLPQ